MEKILKFSGYTLLPVASNYNRKRQRFNLTNLFNDENNDYSQLGYSQ